MHSSIKKLMIFKNEIEQKYPIKVNLRLIRKEAFTGGGGEIAILAFFLGAIGGGFFSEIGKDLWIKSKELCKKIYDSRKARGRGSKGIILVDCEHGNYQIVAVLEINKENRGKLNIIYNGDPLGYFWQELPVRLQNIVEIVNDTGSKIENVVAFKLSLGTEKASWIISGFTKRIDTKKYVEKALK